METESNYAVVGITANMLSLILVTLQVISSCHYTGILLCAQFCTSKKVEKFHD